jgi:phosphoglycolate phosphatase-like HAD superfamily hydrolase
MTNSFSFHAARQAAVSSNQFPAKPDQRAFVSITLRNGSEDVVLFVNDSDLAMEIGRAFGDAAAFLMRQKETRKR